MYLSFNRNLEVMKNTTYIEKCLEFDACTCILTFAKKGTVAYITKKKGYCSLYYEKKSRFAYKRGVLLGLKIIYSYFHKKGYCSLYYEKIAFCL